MRKLILAALCVTALACFAATGTAYAGGCDKPCCKQDTCSTCKTCKPACEKKCDTCKPQCEPKCEKKCEPCCKQDTCSTCKPKCEKPCCEKQECGKCNECQPKCESKCGSCAPRHPYENCWNGSGMLCDTGCCGVELPCKRVCTDCETICKTVETTDPCTGCVTVEYVYETVCHEITRPRVIPWWFNEPGKGNIYLDENGNPVG